MKIATSVRRPWRVGVADDWRGGPFALLRTGPCRGRWPTAGPPASRRLENAGLLMRNLGHPRPSRAPREAEGIVGATAAERGRHWQGVRDTAQAVSAKSAQRDAESGQDGRPGWRLFCSNEV